MSRSCVIPDEILDKYHIYRGFSDDLIGIYETFLTVTDYKITKLYEGVSQDFDHVSEIIEDFKEHEAEVVYYRQLARKELGELLEEMYEEQKAREEERKKAEQALEDGYLPSAEADAIKAEEQKHHKESSEECDCKIE